MTLVLALCAAAAPQARVTAIVADRVVTVTGGIVENGVILIKNGKIEKIAPRLTPPPGAEIVEAGTLAAYPGMILARTRIGLSAGQGSVVETLWPYDGRYDRIRACGFTALGLVPAGGDLVSGLGAVARPLARAKDEIVLGKSDFLCMNFSAAQARALPGLLRPEGQGPLALAVPLVANFLTLRPHLRHVARRSPVTWRVLIVGGIPMFALAALSLLYSTIDIPIVEAVSGDEVVGWYTLAYRWVLMPIFINTIVATAFLPQMSALAATAPERFCALTNRAIKMVMAITIPGAVGILLISSDLIDLLYGPAYEQSVVLMQLLAPFVPLVALNTVLGTALVASDRHHRHIWVAAAAAVFNPPIAFLAIRLANDRYDGNGAIGAAIVTVLTEIFITVCAMKMRRRGVFDRGTTWFCARCLLAAGAMAAAVFLLRDGGLFVKVGVGAVVYGLASLAVGNVSVAAVKGSLDSVRRAGAGEQLTDVSGPAETAEPMGKS